MRRTTWSILLAAAALGPWAAPAARGGLIVGNIGQTTTDEIAILASDQRLAVRVDLDDTFPTGYTLTSLVLTLSSSDTETVALQLFADDSGVPGTPLADLGTAEVAGATPQDITFTPPAPPALTPGTSFWLVLGAPTAGDVPTLLWAATDSSALDAGSLPGASLPTPYAISDDGGATWRLSTNTLRPQIQLNGEAVPVVPEPSTLALAAIGGAGLLVYGRLRRRRA
ncbi:MAG: PEP-CTERM sorting domain-containing protein [Isosphaeraceae bacterium]